MRNKLNFFNLNKNKRLINARPEDQHQKSKNNIKNKMKKQKN